MIDASFGTKSREATVSGAYQYDTGQRLRLTGLPTAEELMAQDELLDENGVINVVAQFAFRGDSRTEERSAFWNEEEGVWIVEIPDIYLQRSADVHMYIFVGYGSTDEASRGKTVYEAVFRPISRPAPDTAVSPAVVDAWAALSAEVRLLIDVDMAQAEARANNAAVTANTAAEGADAAAGRANAAAASADEYIGTVGRMQVTGFYSGTGDEVTVNVTDKTDEDGNPYKYVRFMFPQRAAFVNGKAVAWDGSITLTAADVGAMPATHQTVFEFTATLPAKSKGIIHSVAVEGMLATDRPIVDVDVASMEEDDREAVLEAWPNILSIGAMDGRIYVAYAEDTEVAIPIRLLCVR